jgi:hypothetical protein
MPDFNLPESFRTFDWFILSLRVAFIFLVYYFLYQVARVSLRELVTIGNAAAGPSERRGAIPSPASGLEILDPAESSYDPGYTIPLAHYTTIGRHDGNAVEIDDGFVSGSHAEITFDNGAWWLQDLNSTNGTFVNNQRVRSRVRLADGDIVQFGRVQLRAHL